MGITHDLPKQLGLCVICFLLAGIARGGTVSMDGSLPGTVAVSGSTYTISSGRQAGGNQFYSFGQLNLVKGDIASFSATSGVSNVFARVTGGQSSIDGTIHAPGASFFLINNQGVIFGPDASLNVGGSFTVTTADELKFADGKVFMATPSGSDATLSTAAPSAFGFLASHPAGITVNGGALTIDSGGTAHLHPSLNPAPTGSLTAVGGNITINGGELATSGTGSATIVSVGSPGTVTLSNPTDASSFSSMGTVTVTSGGLLGSDASSNGGVNSGPVIVVAGNVIVDGTDSTDTAQSHLGSLSGSGNAGSVTVTATGALAVSGGAELGSDANDRFSSNSVGVDSGSVTVSAESATVSGSDATGENSLLGSGFGIGMAGPVSVTVAGQLTISEGAELESSAGPFPFNSITVSGGSSGTVTVSAGNVMIEGYDSSSGSSSVLANITGTGNGGALNLTTQILSVLNGGLIYSESNGGGDGGVVNVNATGLIALNGNSAGFAAISAQSLAGGGKCGNVNVSTKTMSVLDGGNIDTGTFGTGEGGTCNVTVSGLLTLDGGVLGATGFTGIASQTQFGTPGGGRGGDVILTAGTLEITNGAQISAVTSGSGNSGGCTVTAGTLSVLYGGEINASTSGTGEGGNCNVMVSGLLTLDAGSGAIGVTAIGAESTLKTPGGGNGGDVSVVAATLSILNGAEISASTSGTGAGGSITVNVTGLLNLDGGTTGSITGIGASSQLDTPGGGNAGDVIVNAGTLSILNGAQINANTFGTGVGGSVTVNVMGPLDLDGGTTSSITGIGAQSQLTTPGGGKGGDVNVTAGTLSILNGARISAASLGAGVAGGVSINVQDLVLISSGSTVDVSSVNSNGGNISVSSGEDILISEDSGISAQAGGNGGNITMTAPDFIIVSNSEIDGHAGLSGGQITIDPQLVIIGPNSVVDGSANGRDVLVAIQPSGGFLLSNDSQILTNRGQYTIDNDIVASLALLESSLADLTAQLEPTCAMFAGGDSSTLIESSNGGLPPQPGGWNVLAIPDNPQKREMGK